MTTGWLLFNYVLVAIVAAIVAVPAVLIPLRLDREAVLVRTSAGAATPQFRRDGERLSDAA